ncbi:MAG TPA: M15 family metallopeptidase [Steroidobacteraceae bacterium]
MPYVRLHGYKPMAELDPEQLTGRTWTHVQELLEPRCTLHPEAARAFLALRAAAAADGLDVVPASSFRDFDRQLTIWNDKFLGRRTLLDRDGRALDPRQMAEADVVRAILQWSALPGASRHHWGTEIDVLDRRALKSGQAVELVPREYAADGVFANLGHWLAQHAAGFGFFRPYDRDRGGVQPEPWHLSYAPIAGAALPSLTLEVLARALQDVALAGAGTVLANLGDIHARYVRAVADPGAVALAAPRLSSVRG